MSTAPSVAPGFYAEAFSRRIRSFDDLTVLQGSESTIVTLFSGGVDSSYLLAMLKKMDFKRVVAVSVDVGEDVDKRQIAETCKTLGAELRCIDAQEEFAHDFVLRAIQANAKYFGIYPISASLSRPIIAAHAVRVAREIGADILLHTANQSQNSLRRLNGAIKSVGFNGFFGSPYEYSGLTRQAKARELSKYGLKYYLDRKLSADANLWCREYESGALENPEMFHLEETAYKWSIKPAPSYEDTFTVSFERGVPVAIDGKRYPLVQLIEELNVRAGRAGIGRYAGLEHLAGQEKVLEVREAPAACILLDAYRHIETATMPSTVLITKQQLEQIWVQEAVEGRWYSDLKAGVDAFIETTARKVTGKVTYRLGPQCFFPNSIRADQAMYLTDRDSWEVEKATSESMRTISVKDVSSVRDLNSASIRIPSDSTKDLTSLVGADFSETEIRAFVGECERGARAEDIARRAGVPVATVTEWRSKYR